MKRILLIILILTIFLLSGCSTANTTRTNATTAQTTVKTMATSPEIIERDIPNLTSNDTLLFTFQLSIGERAEGEISVDTTSASTGTVIKVIDPYGNIILQSATKNVVVNDGVVIGTNIQQYPWKFAFLPATSGEYTLEVHEQRVGATTSVHLKVTIYPEKGSAQTSTPTRKTDITITTRTSQPKPTKEEIEALFK